MRAIAPFVTAAAALVASPVVVVAAEPTYLVVDIHKEIAQDFSFGEGFATSVATDIAKNGVVVGHVARGNDALTTSGWGFARIASSRNMLEDIVSILPRAGTGRVRLLHVEFDELTLRVTATGELRAAGADAPVALRWVRQAGGTDSLQHFPVNGVSGAPEPAHGAAALRRVNAAGARVGSAMREDNEQRQPCVWLPDGLGQYPNDPVFLPLLPGDERGEARAVNDNGWIVGFTTLSELGANEDLSQRHAALWKPDGAGGYTLVDITSQIASGAGFASINTAFSINNRNEIAGFGVTTTGARHAVLLQPDVDSNGVADFMDALARFLAPPAPAP